MNKAQKKRNPRYKNVRAPKGKAWCTEHKQYEPIEIDGQPNFSKNRANANGLNSRCKQGQREYTQRYTAQYGNRNDYTKTIRVMPTAHAMFKQICEHIGVSMEQNISVAIRFWIEYGCKHPKCPKPRGARFDRCDRHALELVADRERAS